MRRTTFTTLICLLFAGAAIAGEHNLEYLLGHFEKTASIFQNEVDGLSEAQWRFKPAPDRWSVAECAQHIVLSEDFLRALIADKVLGAPTAPEETGGNPRVSDDEVLAMVVDRSFQAKAPEPLQPVAVAAGPADLVRDFAVRRAKTVALVRDSAARLRSHRMDHPIGKSLDAFQWLLFLSGHTQRHVLQIREVKAHPDFPR